MSESSARLRLFFALWPQPALQARLHEVACDLQRQVGGKPTREHSIHLTLVFLGDVAAARLPEVSALGASIRCEAFTLTLDTCGCWSHNRIAWLAPAQTPRALQDMAEALQSGVRKLGFEIDERSYAPHITLVRKAACTRDAELPRTRIDWAVDHFALMRSQLDARGSRYSAIAQWPAGASSRGESNT